MRIGGYSGHSWKRKVSLERFLRSAVKGLALSREHHLRIVDQAFLLMDQFYANLYLKESLHAVDPRRRLELLRHRITHSVEPLEPLDFHRQVNAVFVSVRDRHVNYYWPGTLKDRFAWLGCEIEECWEGKNRHYLVTRIHPQVQSERRGFIPGARLTHWNGVPIRRALELQAERLPGSNPEARRAFGLARFSYIPLSHAAPPEERWVKATYRPAKRLADGSIVLGDKTKNKDLQWRVFKYRSREGPRQRGLSGPNSGIDPESDQNRRIRQEIVEVPEEERRKGLVYHPSLLEPDSDFPMIYLRLFSFSFREIWTLLDALRQEIHSLSGQSGLIVDIRDNPGGSIELAELLLQGLTDRRVQPARFQFPVTESALELVQRVRTSIERGNEIELAPEREPREWRKWADSIRSGLQSGERYSVARSITTHKFLQNARQTRIFYGPLLLITNARTYSAADMFAAGFKDNGLGKILGTSNRTGAGGGQTIDHEELVQILGGPSSHEDICPHRLRPLPPGVGMSVAFRRAVRVGARRAGLPLEDLGVQPDRIHRLTRNDLLESNVDLKRKARELLLDQESLMSVRWTGDVGWSVEVLLKRQEDLKLLRFYLLNARAKLIGSDQEDRVELPYEFGGKLVAPSDPVPVRTPADRAFKYAVEIRNPPPHAAALLVKAVRGSTTVAGCVLQR